MPAAGGHSFLTRQGENHERRTDATGRFADDTAYSEQGAAPAAGDARTEHARGRATAADASVHAAISDGVKRYSFTAPVREET